MPNILIAEDKPSVIGAMAEQLWALGFTSQIPLNNFYRQAELAPVIFSRGDIVMHLTTSVKGALAAASSATIWDIAFMDYQLIDGASTDATVMLVEKPVPPLVVLISSTVNDQIFDLSLNLNNPINNQAVIAGSKSCHQVFAFISKKFDVDLTTIPPEKPNKTPPKQWPDDLGNGNA